MPLRAYLHMYSTNVISLCSRFPPAYRTSQQDERGDANDSNKLGLVTNNTEQKEGERRRCRGEKKQWSAQIIIIYPPPEATSEAASKTRVTLPRAAWTQNVRWHGKDMTATERGGRKYSTLTLNMYSSFHMAHIKMTDAWAFTHWFAREGLLIDV